MNTGNIKGGRRRAMAGLAMAGVLAGGLSLTACSSGASAPVTPQEQAAVTFIKEYWSAHPDWATLKSVTTTAWFAANNGHSDAQPNSTTMAGVTYTYSVSATDVQVMSASGDTVTVAYTAVAGNCTPNPVFCGNKLNAPGGSYGPMSQTLTMQNVDGTWRVSASGQPAS